MSAQDILDMEGRATLRIFNVETGAVIYETEVTDVTVTIEEPPMKHSKERPLIPGLYYFAPDGCTLFGPHLVEVTLEGHDFRHYRDITTNSPPMEGRFLKEGQWLGPLPAAKITKKGELKLKD